MSSDHAAINHTDTILEHESKRDSRASVKVINSVHSLICVRITSNESVPTALNSYLLLKDILPVHGTEELVCHHFFGILRTSSKP